MKIMPKSIFRQVIVGAIVATTLWSLTITPAQAQSPTPKIQVTAGATVGSFDFFKIFTDTSKNVAQFNEGLVRAAVGDVNIDGMTYAIQTGVKVDWLNSLLGAPGLEMASKGDGIKKPTPASSLESQQILAEHYGNGGVLGGLGRGIALLYQPPATTQTYVADLLDSARIVPKAEAQGLGFAALDPILSTWKVFRNLAYLMFVIVFLVIGFMVMMRQKMGQTAVTLQQAIPNVIVSLLFVTFSYAIAGFLIDIMYLVMYLIIGMFPSLQGQNIMDENFLNLGFDLIAGKAGNIGAFSSVYGQVNKFVSQATQNVSTDSSLQGVLSGVTMALIMAVAIVFGVFKLFFELLKTYVTIILEIAFSPLILMFGAIPGQNPFKQWLTDIIGNLAAFPVTLLLIVVFRMFTSSDLNTGGFMPPFLIGRGIGGAVTTLVGIGVVLIMSEIVVEAKKAIGVKEGVFTALGKKMITNFGEGAQIGSAPVAAGLGFLGGAAVHGLGAAYNHWGERPDIFAKSVAKAGWQGGQYGAGSNMKRNYDMMSRLGAKTPSQFGFVDDMVKSAGTNLSEEGQLKRISENHPTVLDRVRFPDKLVGASEERRKNAEAQKQLKIFKEEQDRKRADKIEAAKH